MYLHRDDRDLLRDMILTVSEMSGLPENIVEKDYYVTVILRELAERNPGIVFKGGTSLSKAYHVIDRFSEDIDVTFAEHIGEARRKKLKYGLLKSVSEDLDLPIDNWDDIESDKNYNHYDFRYVPVTFADDMLTPYIKLETALMSYAYPTERKEIGNILYEYLNASDSDLLIQYHMEPFSMQVQSLERTFIDKLFAVCDYYMAGKASRNSRHLYDIYKLGPYIKMDADFRCLVSDVREHRAVMGVRIAPSAQAECDLVEMSLEIRRSAFYKKDFEESTVRLIHDRVSYETALEFYEDIMARLF